MQDKVLKKAYQVAQHILFFLYYFLTYFNLWYKSLILITFIFRKY